MKFSLIHPTRNRPKMAYDTFCEWVEKADDLNNFEYILSVDLDDVSLIDYGKWQAPDNFFVLANTNKTAIEAINFAAFHAKNEVFIVLSDDFSCPEHWDTLLLKELEGKSDFCAKTDDGLQPTLITMPVMDQIYYQQYSYIYHNDYLHLHADEELTCVALMTGKYIKIPLLFPHNHYSTGRTEKDEINVKNDSTWGQGQRTLDHHALNNFGIENPVIQRKDIVWR